MRKSGRLTDIKGGYEDGLWQFIKEENNVCMVDGVKFIPSGGENLPNITQKGDFLFFHEKGVMNLYKGEEKWEFGGSIEKVYVFCGEFKILKDPASFNWNVLSRGKVTFGNGDVWEGYFKNFKWNGQKDGWNCDFAGFEMDRAKGLGEKDVGKGVVHHCLHTDSDFVVL